MWASHLPCSYPVWNSKMRILQMNIVATSWHFEVTIPLAALRKTSVCHGTIFHFLETRGNSELRYTIYPFYLDCNFVIFNTLSCRAILLLSIIFRVRLWKITLFLLCSARNEVGFDRRERATWWRWRQNSDTDSDRRCPNAMLFRIRLLFVLVR